MVMATLSQHQRQIQRTYLAYADRVSQARHAITEFLGDSPRADDAVLIISELATNSVKFSRSRAPGGRFIVRAEIHADARYIWLECEDEGGPWLGRPRDGRGHGLDLVEHLCGGPPNWGVDDMPGVGRVVWARLDIRENT